MTTDQKKCNEQYLVSEIKLLQQASDQAEKDMEETVQDINKLMDKSQATQKANNDRAKQIDSLKALLATFA